MRREKQAASERKLQRERARENECERARERQGESVRAFVCHTEGENVGRAREKLYLKSDKDKRETGKPKQQERQNQKDRKAEWESECERRQ